MANQERVVIVDRDNRVVGAAARREVRECGLPHRSTYILVFNSQGELYVQKRTMTKDVYPGYWDPVAGGVVLEGESYEQGAARELAEEMGIRGAPIEPLFDFWFEEASLRVWGRAFQCRWDGALELQQEEVEGVELMSPARVLERSREERFTPDGLLTLRRYLGDTIRG